MGWMDVPKLWDEAGSPRSGARLRQMVARFSTMRSGLLRLQSLSGGNFGNLASLSRQFAASANQRAAACYQLQVTQRPDNIKIERTYLNPKYTLSEQATNARTGEGLLKVFELTHSGDGPSFIGRWDGGSRDPGKTERYDLDIDIYGVADEEKLRFKYGQGGYSGHHTKKVDSNKGHKYQVSLCTSDEKIFEGTVCFNLLRKIEF
jgi:hypothetical protein